MSHTPTRAAQKQQTRETLLSAALTLMREQSLSSLSLREVTRAAGIVPAAFYRHFPDIPSLGVALVEQSLGSLRAAVRAVREGLTDPDEVIDVSINVLVAAVHAEPERFRFVARERHGGVAAVRQSIADELALFGEELGSDVAGAFGVADWPAEDLRMLTTLVVHHMVLTAAAILDAPDDVAERQVIETARRQLRLIVIGSRHWLEEHDR